jgi:EAL domain-containing protein (putative c-di-GMP-specific phosphodiesterase class I)
MTCAFESLFQPIVDTAGHRILAHQCDAGEGIDVAIRSAAGQSTDGLYFINSWILNPCFPSILDAASESGLHPSNIVFEIAETAVAEDPGHWRRVCDWYRQNGFRIALANAGSTLRNGGTDSLQTLVDLRPDYIKLEKTLVWDIEKRPNTVMIRKLADLAEKFEVSIMADGVERHRTVENLWLLSVNIMQGALFGRPASGIIHSHSTDLANLAQAVGHEPVKASSR